MSGNLSTSLDRPYAQQPETRAAAVRRVSREDQADMLLDMLGLTDQPELAEREQPDEPR